MTDKSLALKILSRFRNKQQFSLLVLKATTSKNVKLLDDALRKIYTLVNVEDIKSGKDKTKSPYLEVKITRAKEFHSGLNRKFKEAQQVVQQRELKLLCRRMALEPRITEMQEVMNENPIRHEEELSERSSWEAPTFVPKGGLWGTIAKK